MSNIAQNPDSRPSEIPPPPASEKKPRRRAKKAKPEHNRNHAAHQERIHEDRIRARKRSEALERARHVFAYRALVNEMESDPITSFSLPAVLARSVGNGVGDLLTALLEETLIRTRTLGAACTSDLDPFDRLETIECELLMLQQRAEVAIELVRRCGFGELTDWDLALLRDDDGANACLDAAAEE